MSQNDNHDREEDMADVVMSQNNLCEQDDEPVTMEHSFVEIVKSLCFDVITSNHAHAGRLIFKKEIMPTWLTGWDSWSDKEVAIGPISDSRYKIVKDEIVNEICQFCEERGRPLNRAQKSELREALKRCEYVPENQQSNKESRGN